VEPPNVDLHHISDVIATFLDRERVDSNALKQALSTEEGRDYLIELLALREVIAEPAASVPVAPVAGRRRRWPARVVTAAAGVVIAVAGYQAGALSAVPAPTTSVPAEARGTASVSPNTGAAPAPTSVIYLEPGIDWHQGGAN